LSIFRVRPELEPEELADLIANRIKYESGGLRELDASRELELAISAPRYAEARTRWKPLQELSVSLRDVTKHLPELCKRLEDIADETILFFWASSAMLTVRGSNMFGRAGKQISMVTGKRHHPYSELRSEPREEEFIAVERHGSSMYEKYDYRTMVGVLSVRID
jgi:hypothetical protein